MSLSVEAIDSLFSFYITRTLWALMLAYYEFFANILITPIIDSLVSIYLYGLVAFHIYIIHYLFT